MDHPLAIVDCRYFFTTTEKCDGNDDTIMLTFLLGEGIDDALLSEFLNLSKDSTFTSGSTARHLMEIIKDRNQISVRFYSRDYSNN
jgi:hypothetical protein